MPRPRGDQDTRRRDVSEAVWRVLAERGFSGLTMRAVAARLGATTGLLTHYFPSKRDLVGYALDLLEQRNTARPRPVGAPGLAALRAVLLEVLPGAGSAGDDSRIWVSSWDAALADPTLAAEHARRYAQGRARLRELVVAAQEVGELPAADPDAVAAGLQSFVLGLVVQALFDPETFPPDRQVALLDGQLAALRRTQP
jgi:AcrR family transcriptional regulator